MQIDPRGFGDLAGAQVFLNFDTTKLQVESLTHISTTLPSAVPTLIENSMGVARFAAFTTNPLSASQPPFDFVSIRFSSIALTPLGSPTQVVFEYAGDGSKTTVTDIQGGELLMKTGDFTTAWIRVVP